MGSSIGSLIGGGAGFLVGGPMGAAIGAGIGGSVGGAVDANNAANKQVDAANNATALQQSMFNKTQENLQPYMQGGSTALSSLLDKIKSGQLGGSFTGADYLANKDPGYEFQLQQGQQALQNSQAAGDGVLSGAALKNLINYNQGMASTGYQNAYNRWLANQQNTYSQLSGLASLGENAGANVGNAGVGYSNGMANTITGAGNAAAAGIVGGANAINSGVSNAGSMYMLKNLLGGLGGTTSTASVGNAGYGNYADPNFLASAAMSAW